MTHHVMTRHVMIHHVMTQHVLRLFSMLKPSTWFILGFFAVTLIVVGSNTSLLISPTDSLDGHVYLLIRGSEYSKGNVITVEDHNTKYTNRVRFTKHLSGVAGDKIRKFDKWVWVGGKGAGYLNAQTTKGEKLTPIKHEIIPQGYVFLSGTHPRSFDSRYQEFGLVAANKIVGRAIRLW